MIGAVRNELCECGCGNPLLPATRTTRYYPAKFIPGHYARGRVYPQRRVLPAPGKEPDGFCGCGCGRRTNIATSSEPRKGRYKGLPMPFIRGHSIKPAFEDHWHHTGKRVVKGYVYVYRPEHPNARTGSFKGFVLEHRVVMEGILGRLLANHETVHHINGDHGDNRPENLQLRHGRHGAGVVLTCAQCGSVDIQHVKIATPRR